MFRSAITLSIIVLATAFAIAQDSQQVQRPFDTELARAQSFTAQAEALIWKLPAHLQPVAWARMFALWYESGYRSELRHLRDDPSWRQVDLDTELECGNLPDAWLKAALDGIARRSETMEARRQRLISADHVRQALGPLGKGIENCVLVEMQSKLQNKKTLPHDWPRVTPEERLLLQPVADRLGKTAERFAQDADTFDRAVELAHTIIKLRSAAPLAGFLKALRESGRPDAIDVENEVLGEAVDSMEMDSDPVFATELGNVLFPPLEPLRSSPAHNRYLADLPNTLGVAAVSNSDDRDVLCGLAAVEQRLQTLSQPLPANSVATSIVSTCFAYQVSDADDTGAAAAPRSVADYLAAVKTARSPLLRAKYKLAAARLALRQDPAYAASIAMSVTPEERAAYSRGGSWRVEAEKIAAEAAITLHRAGDSQGVEKVWDGVPNLLRAPVEIAVALDAANHTEEHDFGVFALRAAYDTLQHFDADDPEALIGFCNAYARLRPQDANLAFRDAMRWLARVPHRADPWHDRERFQRERQAGSLAGTPTRLRILDLPVAIGYEFKPAAFDEAVLDIPGSDVSFAMSVVSDVSDQISLYLGLAKASLKRAKRLDPDRTAH